MRAQVKFCEKLKNNYFSNTIEMGDLLLGLIPTSIPFTARQNSHKKREREQYSLASIQPKYLFYILCE